MSEHLHFIYFQIQIDKHYLPVSYKNLLLKMINERIVLFKPFFLYSLKRLP